MTAAAPAIELTVIVPAQTERATAVKHSVSDVIVAGGLPLLYIEAG